MELDKFIEETLISIAKGVSNAKSSVKDLGGEVSPHQVSSLGSITAKRQGREPNKFRHKQDIEFDISVQVESKDSVTAKAGATLFSIGVSANGSSNDSSQSAHRIKFSVPMELP